MTGRHSLTILAQGLPGKSEVERDQPQTPVYKCLHGCSFEAYILHPVMLFDTSQRPVTGQHSGESTL